MGQKILIVDDEKNILRMVGYLLEREGYEISATTTGKDALNKIKAELPDLIILDVMMSDMSGFDVCKQLRKQPETTNLPIVLFSALSDEKNMALGFEAGANEYLTKLILPEEFKVRVNALLKRTQAASLSRKRVGNVLGFMGAKGGVGTTTVVLNLATALVQLDKKVVAVEMRPDYGTFSAQLNIRIAEGIGNLLQPISDDISEKQLEKYLIKLHSGLRVLVGPQNVEEFQEIEPRKTKSIINNLATISDFVLLDLSCHASKMNRAVVQESDQIVLVVEAEPTSLSSAQSTLNLLKSWGITRQNIKLVVVNPTSIANAVKISDIGTILECAVLGTIPPSIEILTVAQEKGIPMVLSHPEGMGAVAFHDIAKYIIADCD